MEPPNYKTFASSFWVMTTHLFERLQSDLAIINKLEYYIFANALIVPYVPYLISLFNHLIIEFVDYRKMIATMSPPRI